MRPSDTLYDLIRSLSPSEKRHFKLYAQRHVVGEENNYLKLFEAIDKQSEYDEPVLKKKFSREKFIQQLHVAKNYLYSLILKSLNEYHSTDSGNIQLREMFNSAEILFGKGLYKQASKITGKIKTLAYRNEKQTFALEAIVLENEIIFAQQDMGAARAAIANGSKEEEQLLKDYQQARQFKHLSDRLKILIKTKGTIKGNEDTIELEKIIEHPLLNSGQKAISYNTKYSFLNVYSKYFTVKEDFKLAYPYCNKLVQLMESNPEQLSKNPREYIRALNSLLIVLKELRKFDEFEVALEKLKSAHSNTLYFQAKSFAYIFIHEWNLYFYMGRYQKCIALIPFLEDGLKQYDAQITSDLKLLCYFNVFYGYFVVNDYQQAVKWMNKILNDERTEIRQDIRSFAMVLNILLYYEMKEFDLLEYLIRSTQRFLEKEKNSNEFELLVLTHVKQLTKAQSEDGQRNVFIRFRNKLLFTNLNNYMIAVSKGSSEKIVLKTFDILAWLESKIEGRSFSDVLQETEKDKQLN